MKNMTIYEKNLREMLNDIAESGMDADEVQNNYFLREDLSAAALAFFNKNVFTSHKNRNMVISGDMETDELANDACMVMLRSLDKVLSIPADERIAYITSIGSSRTIDHIRKHNRVYGAIDFPDEIEWNTYSDSTDIETDLVNNDMVREVMAVVAASVKPLETLALLANVVLQRKTGDIADDLTHRTFMEVFSETVLEACKLYRIDPKMFKESLIKASQHDRDYSTESHDRVADLVSKACYNAKAAVKKHMAKVA
ncbi:MAG: hypothetical protein IJ315_01595 [Firmicutes bacterium]|nr:hypothetical protein [Bacillota bacterium]